MAASDICPHDVIEHAIHARKMTDIRTFVSNGSAHERNDGEETSARGITPPRALNDGRRLHNVSKQRVYIR